MARTILIREQNFDGHRWMYVRLLLERLESEDARVHVATSANTSDALVAHIRASGAQVHEGEWSGLPQLAELSDRIGADLVVVPDGDEVALSLGRGARWGSTATLRVLVMRARAQPTGSPVMDFARRGLRNMLIARAKARSSVEIMTLCSGTKPSPREGEVPDPVEFTPRTNSPLDLDATTFWLGIVGAVDERKNPRMVLEACAVASIRSGRSIGLVIAGRFAASVASASWLRSAHAVPLIAENRLLEDDELDALVRDLDAVVLAHSNDGPSGILVKAAAAGTRILAAGSSVLRQDVKDLSQGALWTHLNVSDLADGIVRLIEMESPTPRSLDAREFCRRMLK